MQKHCGFLLWGQDVLGGNVYAASSRSLSPRINIMIKAKNMLSNFCLVKKRSFDINPVSIWKIIFITFVATEKRDHHQEKNDSFPNLQLNKLCVLSEMSEGNSFSWFPFKYLRTSNINIYFHHYYHHGQNHNNILERDWLSPARFEH